MDPSNLLDMFLLKASLSYHGSQLLENLQAEQQIDIHNLLPDAQTGLLKHHRDEFNQRLLKFIAKKADLLFAKESSGGVHWPCNSINEDHFAAVPPLEHFMDIQKPQRRQHFQEGIEFGNVIIGVVTAVQENGLLLNILTIEIGQIRHLDQLKLVAFCPLREISRSHGHDDALESFNPRDKVRAVVLNVQEDRLIVSMQKRHLPSSVDLHLGLVNDEDLPLHYRRLLESLDSGGSTYESYLRQVLEFHNPSGVANLTSMFGIKEFGQQPSLMRGLFSVKYKEEDYGDRLRKGQSCRLAMKSVAEGVKRFKDGENLEAMQLFNRALQIDPENNEALVARGAIYANCESYERAINDFEKAVRLNPSHANAKKYLHQTLTAFAYNLMDKNLDLAESYVRRAVELNPNNEETIALMKLIQKKLESDQKVSPGSSDSGHDVNENESVINHAKEILVKMIQDDQSGRGSHQKSRTLSDASDKRSISDRRLSHDSAELTKHSQLLLRCNDEDKNRRHWNDQSPSNRRLSISTTGDKMASGSKVFKSMMTSGHCEGSAGLRQYTAAVFGPALPPRMAKKKTRKRQKKKSYKSSSSSSSSSRSSSRSSSSTDSTSSSSSSTSSSISSSSSYSTTKKYSKNSGNHKSLQKRSPRFKKNVHSDEKTNRGNRSGSIKLDMKSDHHLKKQASQEVDSARTAKDSSEYSRSRNHKTSTACEKPVKRMKTDHEDSDDRRATKSASFSRRKDDNREAKKQARNENPEKKSFVEYSSSSSDSCDDSRNEKKRKKLDSDQIKKETEGNRPAEGETLEDLEQFLQQLKAKKVAAK